MTRDEILALAHRAGVLPHEMRDDPVHGLMISACGVRKMAEVAPDPERARRKVREMGADVGSVLGISATIQGDE